MSECNYYCFSVKDRRNQGSVKWKGRLKWDRPGFRFLPWSLLAERPWECSAEKWRGSCEEYRTQLSTLNRLCPKMQFPFPLPTITSYNDAGGVSLNWGNSGRITGRDNILPEERVDPRNPINSVQREIRIWLMWGREFPWPKT